MGLRGAKRFPRLRRSSAVPRVVPPTIECMASSAAATFTRDARRCSSAAPTLRWSSTSTDGMRRCQTPAEERVAEGIGSLARRFAHPRATRRAIPVREHLVAGIRNPQCIAFEHQRQCVEAERSHTRGPPRSRRTPLDLRFAELINDRKQALGHRRVGEQRCGTGLPLFRSSGDLTPVDATNRGTPSVRSWSARTRLSSPQSLASLTVGGDLGLRERIEDDFLAEVCR